MRQKGIIHVKDEKDNSIYVPVCISITGNGTAKHYR